MESIFILLTRSDTCLSKTIYLVTLDKYTHVSIAFDKNFDSFYSFSRKNFRFPLPAGLTKENFLGDHFLKKGHLHCALYELKVSKEVYEQAKASVDKMYRNKDFYRFNILGLLFCRFGIEHQRNTHYFCSQFVGEILNNNNLIKLPKPPSLMRPIDYTKLNELVCLYEGNVGELTAQRLNFV